MINAYWNFEYEYAKWNEVNNPTGRYIYSCIEFVSAIYTRSLNFLLGPTRFTVCIISIDHIQEIDNTGFSPFSCLKTFFLSENNFQLMLLKFQEKLSQTLFPKCSNKFGKNSEIILFLFFCLLTFFMRIRISVRNSNHN
jgi:hypothetical protein